MSRRGVAGKRWCTGGGGAGGGGADGGWSSSWLIWCIDAVVEHRVPAGSFWINHLLRREEGETALKSLSHCSRRNGLAVRGNLISGSPPPKRPRQLIKCRLKWLEAESLQVHFHSKSCLPTSSLGQVFPLFWTTGQRGFDLLTSREWTTDSWAAVLIFTDDSLHLLNLHAEKLFLFSTPQAIVDMDSLTFWYSYLLAGMLTTSCQSSDYSNVISWLACSAFA